MYFSYQEVLYLIGSVSLIFITVFLCWALYQLAITLKNANSILMDTQDKLHRVDGAVSAFTEKMSNITSYLGFIAEGGKQLLGFLGKGDEKEKRLPAKRVKKVLSEWE